MRGKLYLNFILALLLLSSQASYAQLTITSNDTTICSGASVILNSTQFARMANTISFPLNITNPATVDDSYSGIIPIGFSFDFYGTSYSQCVVSSNGYISFNTSNANGFSPYTISGGIPGNAATHNSILGVYSDWEPLVGSINYSTIGAAPNRRFIVSFCGTPLFSTSIACNNLLGTSQIILYETSNIIEIHVGRKPICQTWNSGYSIEGIQNNAGNLAVVAPVQTFVGPGTTNFPWPWTAYHMSHRFTPSSSTSYTLTSIPYAPIPTNSAYAWYINGTTLLPGGASVTVSPTSTTFYTIRK